MFERFSPTARRVVVLSQEEARMLHHNYIGPEHILLAVLHTGQGDNAKLMAEEGVTLEGAREAVGQIIGTGMEAATGAIPFTHRARLILDAAVDTAIAIGFTSVTEDHILLSLLRTGDELDSVVGQVLTTFGASAADAALLLEEKLKAQDPAVDAATPVGEALAVFKRSLGQELDVPHERLKAAMTEALRAAKLAESGLTRSA